MAPAMIAQILNAPKETMRGMENAVSAEISRNTATHTARVHILVVNAEQKRLVTKILQHSQTKWEVRLLIAVQRMLDRVELRKRKKPISLTAMDGLMQLKTH